MNYFTAGIYGNKMLYEKIKQVLVRPSDKLWILGDVLDGNDEAPWESLEILEDIERSKNIHLILGDHEYFHTMRILSSENEEAADAWEESLGTLELSGKPLIEYMKNELSEEEIFNYASFLSQCEVSEIIRIGERFFYLCHGAPTMRIRSQPGGDMAWQYGVVSNDIDFSSMYLAEMAGDNRIREFEKRYEGIDFSKCFVLSGHGFSDQLRNNGIKLVEGIVYQNKKFCVNPYRSSKYPDECSKWPVLGIDAAGFFIEEI